MRAKALTDDECGRIKNRLNFIVKLIVSYIARKDERAVEVMLQPQLYNLFKEIDWYCNGKYPEGGRIVTSKSKVSVVKQALAPYIPCKGKSRSDAVCDNCRLRFLCYPSRNKEIAVETIEEIAKRERKVFYRRKLYEDAVSEDEFNERKKQLFDYLEREESL